MMSIRAKTGRFRLLALRFQVREGERELEGKERRERRKKEEEGRKTHLFFKFLNNN